MVMETISGVFSGNEAASSITILDTSLTVGEAKQRLGPTHYPLLVLIRRKQPVGWISASRLCNR